VSSLVLPEQITIDVLLWAGHQAVAYRGAPIVLGIKTYARAKNDYHLGPIFTDHDGHVRLTRADLNHYESAIVAQGIMDVRALGESYSFVQIVHWTSEQIGRAIDARTKTWTQLLPGEKELFGSVSDLIRRLQGAGNARFSPMLWPPVRDEWDGRPGPREYKYILNLAAA